MSHLCAQEIYNASNAVRSAIPHPRIMGVIKECGGKMWMGERKDISFIHRTSNLLYPPGQWNRASEDFFESFRNYDETGSPQRIQVLKYLVLANMLTGSEVNPFDSQETKPYVMLFSFRRRLKFSFSYKTDPQIKAMTDLVDAYQRREVHLAEKILKGLSLIYCLIPPIEGSSGPKIIDLPSWMIISFAHISASYFAVCVLNTSSTL